MLYRGVNHEYVHSDRDQLSRHDQSETVGYEPARAGFLLQLFDAINRSWPHPQHEVFNAATDGKQQVDTYWYVVPAAAKALAIRASSGGRMLSQAACRGLESQFRLSRARPSHGAMWTPMVTPGTPVDSVLPCLFSHLPHAVHLVVLEFGSMARYTTMAAVEATLRVLLSLPSRPAIVLQDG